MTNTELIERLYEGLRRLDGDAMAACYTADARFEDPAFGVLTGDQVGGMWRMLTSRSHGIEVELVGGAGRRHARLSPLGGPLHVSARQSVRSSIRSTPASRLRTVSSPTMSTPSPSTPGPRRHSGRSGFFLGATPFLKNRVQGPGPAPVSMDSWRTRAEGRELTAVRPWTENRPGAIIRPWNREPGLIEWLSSPDNPPVRYLAARDLIEPPPSADVLAGMRTRILEWEPLRMILDPQQDDGSFPFAQKTVTAQPMFTASQPHASMRTDHHR